MAPRREKSRKNEGGRIAGSVGGVTGEERILIDRLAALTKPRDLASALLALDLLPPAADHAIRRREGMLRALAGGGLRRSPEHDRHAKGPDGGNVGAVLAHHLELGALQR